MEFVHHAQATAHHASTTTIVLTAFQDSKTLMELVSKQLHAGQINFNTEMLALIVAQLVPSKLVLNAFEAVLLKLITEVKYVGLVAQVDF